MNGQHDMYTRMEQVIEYINSEQPHQVDIDILAKKAGMSRAHFQRTFTEWIGISPKKFMGYMTLQYAKELLKDQSHRSLLEASYKSGLSGNGRLHDLFINIEAMTPGEYKN